MRRTFSWLAVASLMMALAAGCGDDPPNGDWDVGADADEDTTAQADAGDTGGTDAEPSDTGETDTAMDTGDDDTAMDTGGDDTAMDTGGDDTTMDTGDDDTATDTTDVADAEDTSGEVSRDALPMDFGAASFISEFYLDADESTRNNRNTGDPRCCFDIQINGTDQDYDSEQDNALADFLGDIGSAAGFGIGDVNQNINDRIEQGDFIYFFEYKDWDSSNWQNDTSITMYAHPGEDANPPWDWYQVQMGNGLFEILPKSYNSNGDPKSEFKSVSTSPDGSQADLTADDGVVKLELDFGQGLATTFNIRRAELTADIPSNADVTSGGEVAMENGELGGAIPKGDLFRGINQASSSCQCYDMNNNKMIKKQNAETYACDTDPACSCSGTVGSLEQFCSTLREQVAGYCDVNLNGAKSDNDALSIGASFTGVKAKIDGVAP